MKRIVTLISALTLLLAGALPAGAAMPRTMNVQGVLTDDTGAALPDGDYDVIFGLWDAPSGGQVFWMDVVPVTQTGGVFTGLLGTPAYPLPLEPFAGQSWLSIMIGGEPEMTPRIRMAAVPGALCAAAVDSGAAVTSLNGVTDDVTLVAGPNVQITPSGQTVTISATAGAGGDDGDWGMSGNDVYKALGRVYVGFDPSKDVKREYRGGPDKAPITSKLDVVGHNEGIFGFMRETDAAQDDRHAVFGFRTRDVRNDGQGFGAGYTNTAVTGYNDYGDSYTFGVAGYTWFDFDRCAGVLGASQDGAVWGALAYHENYTTDWGLFTPQNAFVGGQLHTVAVITDGLRLQNGASAGYILTSDGNGNASWQAPSAASSDDDWVINGGNLTNSRSGATAIGTSYPHPLAESATRTTLQVSALFNPALTLDAIYGGLSRWALYQSNGALELGHTSDYASTGTSALHIDDGVLEVNGFDGGTRLRLQGDSSSETGARLDMYSTSTGTTQPMVSLDTQSSATDFAGSLTLRDGSGAAVVTATADYNYTGVGRVITPVLEITGGSDLSEQFDVAHALAGIEPGMVVSIDPEHPGRLDLSDRAYDRRVAGVISGAGGVATGMVMGQRGTVADGGVPVALVGRVYVWADASGGPIAPGDLLTTSDVPGHAMKVGDPGRAAGAILGKAMSGLESGRGLILTLVSLQ